MNQVDVWEKIRVPKQPELAELCSDWPQLPPLERARRLRRLVDKGISRRAIAKAVRCSEAWIRQLLDLGDLTAEEKQAMRKGSLSVVEALRRIRQRRLVQPQPQPAKGPTVDLHVDTKAVSFNKRLVSQPTARR